MRIDSRLRSVTTDEELDALVGDPEALRSALAAVGEELGIPGPLTAPERGSAIVGLGPEVVLKMMPPHCDAFCRCELACLEALDGALPIPTPSVLDTGTWNGWRWILMSRLEGVELVDVWPDLARAERLSLATELGEALRSLHALEAPPEVPRLDWSAWKRERLPALEASQRERGCPEALLEGLTEFVEESDLSAGRTTWLHTEVMLEHLLVKRTATGWRLCGLFDFEPSWVAPAHYELAAVGIFVSAGEPAVLRAVLRACRTSADPRRLFAMAMLHRYANLAWYHRRLGGPTSLPALAERWFGQT